MSARGLTMTEKKLAVDVFGGSLPPLNLIFITDNTGFGGRPFAQEQRFKMSASILDLVADNLVGSPGPRIYTLHLGKIAYKNAAANTTTLRFGLSDELFIHEMTHIWQYWHGYPVIADHIAGWIWERLSGDDQYESTPGKDWSAYNVEEQATIVEKWYKEGFKTDGGQSHQLFPYIRDVIRKG